MIEPQVLRGRLIHLEPMTLGHVDALAAVGLDPELWRLQPRVLKTRADMRRYVESALAEQSNGLALPFVIVHNETGQVVGSTRFMDIALEHLRLEVGATWFDSAHQRSGANIDSKLILLGHAFDVIGVEKVVLKTEASNSASRNAILNLGAVEEGTLRRHLVAETGRSRDMVYFSVLRSEWADVRERNRARLARYLS